MQSRVYLSCGPSQPPPPPSLLSSLLTSPVSSRGALLYFQPSVLRADGFLPLLEMIRSLALSQRAPSIQHHRKWYSIRYWAWCMDIATFFSPKKIYWWENKNTHMDSCRTWKESGQHTGNHRPRAMSSILEQGNTLSLGHKFWTVFIPHLPPWDPSSMVTKDKEKQGHLWSTVVTQQLPMMCWIHNADMKENSIFWLCLETRCHWMGEAKKTKKKEEKESVIWKYGTMSASLRVKKGFFKVAHVRQE